MSAGVLVVGPLLYELLRGKHVLLLLTVMNLNMSIVSSDDSLSSAAHMST